MNTVAFKTGQAASRSFQSELWPFLLGYLPNDTSEFILTALDVTLEVGDAVVSRLTVTGQKVRNGVQHVMLKFKSLIGNVKALFQTSVMPDLLCEAETTLSTRTLNDILLPALNVAATKPISVFDGHEGTVAQFVKTLQASKSDIEFYAALLTRFVASNEQAKMSLPDARPQLPAAKPPALIASDPCAEDMDPPGQVINGTTLS